ncbi:MAG: asparaginase [Geminicoccaceae bacterium]|nr:asparaginase [Geminicoccaceae bacterium]
MPTLPKTVEARRGGRAESRHEVHVVVVDPKGGVVAGADPGGTVFPRSAVKPFQALSLITSGAADAFGFGPEELALACASHGGEPMHVERVGAVLERLGLGPDDLACGAHPPLYAEAARALLLRAERPSRLHNNCSGKHAGMLATALHSGEPVRGYEGLDHPVQRRCLAGLRRATGDAILEPPGIDGCGLPNWPVSLKGLARGAARLVTGEGMGEGEAEAAARLVAAMTAHPELVAGTGRLDTEVMRAAPHLVVKTGAEGVYMAAHRGLGLGLALKAVDGATRASEVALMAALEALGWLEDAALEALAERRRPVLRNFAGEVVGEVAAL